MVLTFSCPLTTGPLLPRLKKDIDQPPPGLVGRPPATPPPPTSISKWQSGALWCTGAEKEIAPGKSTNYLCHPCSRAARVKH